VKREHLRPLVHAGVLGFAALTPVLGRWGMAGAAGAAVLVNLFLLPRTRFGKSLARPGERRFGGLVTYPLSVALAFVLFNGGGGLLAWAILALGDPAASFVGGARNWRLRIPWNRRKSFAGFAAFLAGGSAGVILVTGFRALWMGGMDGVGETAFSFEPELLVMVMLGALAETLPIPPDDNLPVALAAGSGWPLIVLWKRLLAGGTGGG